MRGDSDDGAVSQAQMRRHNLSLAFKTIWEQGQTTRAELARTMGLSKPAVTRIVGDLIEVGFVGEIGPDPVTGRGRPATRLVPRADGPAFLGIDLRLDRIIIQARSLTGHLLAETTGPIQTPTSSADLVNILMTTVRRFSTSLERPVGGIGIAVGGWVDEHSERIVGAPYTDWHDIPVPLHVADAIGDHTIPVRMGNVARCAASANWRELSRDPAVRDLVHLQIGIGAGSGRVRRWQPVPKSGIPGNVAHLQLDRNGPLCSCGGRGCLDVMAGFDALVQLVTPNRSRRTRGPRAMQNFCREVVRRADGGDARATAAIEEIAGRVAQAATAMITILRPSRFTIGGYPLLLGDRFRSALLDAARPHVPDIDEIFVATGLGDEASVVGAYLLGVEAAAEDPLRRISAQV